MQTYADTRILAIVARGAGTRRRQLLAAHTSTDQEEYGNGSHPNTGRRLDGGGNHPDDGARSSQGFRASEQPHRALAQPASYGVDDGTRLTMWSRAATQGRVDQALVKAYNATHKNQIDVTYRPDRQLPDQGRRGGRRRTACPTSSRLTSCSCPTGHRRACSPTSPTGSPPCRTRQTSPQAAIDVSTWEGKKYGLPFVVDLSVWMYNKDLFRKAGLRSREAAHDARRSSRLTHGRSPSSVAMSTARSSAATAAAATCSPGGPSPGPTARPS